MEPLFYLTTVPREQMIERLSQRGARQLPYPTNNVLVTSYKQSMNNLKFAPFSLYVLFPLPHVVGSVSAETSIWLQNSLLKTSLASNTCQLETIIS